jgi:uncharacterized protein (DUF1697 family)
MIYIALLRGINVGGHRVKMERLRELFTELGFTHVRTYIQSGNVFFETAQTDRKMVAQTIGQHLHQALGYEVIVFLRTIPELEQIVAIDPFQYITVTPDMRVCVVFTSNLIPKTLALPLRSPKNDVEIVHTTDHEAFMVWYLTNGRPPAAQGFNVLGERTTTRFFHTTAKILQEAKKSEKSEALD